MTDQPAPARTLREPARALLQVGLDLFYERGFDATSVQQIVDGAGVTKGAFYHYFKSKDDLLYLIHDEYLERELEALQAIRRSDLHAAAKVKEVIHHLIESLRQHRRTMSVFIRERRALRPESLAALKSKRDEWSAIFTDILCGGIDSGELVEVGDPTIVGFGVIGMCVWAHEWYNPAGSASAETIAGWYTSLVLSGLLPRES